mmetsp:Transcript_9906/g.8740  ORF Transcript_9906/g.8740 Transcript_9906/m.8740 type:complete len:135 (-) Transcript_9906:149-553(-)
MGSYKLGDKKKIVKRLKPFKRHHSDRYMKVGVSWRKPRGIDSCVRRRFRGTVRMVNIGYKNANATRHQIRGGLRKFLINNLNDIEILLMNNSTHAGEIASTVSARLRVDILNRAKELGVKITNPHGRVRKTPVE